MLSPASLSIPDSTSVESVIEVFSFILPLYYHKTPQLNSSVRGVRHGSVRIKSIRCTPDPSQAQDDVDVNIRHCPESQLHLFCWSATHSLDHLLSGFYSVLQLLPKQHHRLFQSAQ